MYIDCYRDWWYIKSTITPECVKNQKLPNNQLKNMRTRENILSEVIDLSSEIEERQKQINELYKEAKEINDHDDDEWRYTYIQAIKSYTK